MPVFFRCMFINISRISARTLHCCTALRPVKALLDAILTPQLCVRVASAQIAVMASTGASSITLWGAWVVSPSWAAPQLYLSERRGLLGQPWTWPVTVSHLTIPGPSAGPTAVATPLCSPASGVVGLLVGPPLVSPWGAHSPQLTRLERAVPPVLLLMLCFRAQSAWKCRFALEKRSCHAAVAGSLL